MPERFFLDNAEANNIHRIKIDDPMTHHISPKVSVVMSVYNGEEYLREAIESILNQTFEDFEFIVINDGSSDRTKDILESYSDPRIRIFHQENMGLTRSLNNALVLAKGSYIARQDADDISLPHRFQVQKQFLDDNPDIGLIGASSTRIHSNGREIGVVQFPTDNESLQKALLHYNPFFHGSTMFRTDCINRVGYYRDFFACAQDYDLWLRISESTNLSNIPDVLYSQRWHSKSITSSRLYSQLLFRDLAKDLAVQRRRSGTDQELYNHYVNTFEDIYKANEKRLKSEVQVHITNWIDENIKVKDFSSAYYLAMNLYRTDRTNKAHYIIFARVIKNYLESKLNSTNIQ